MKAYIIAGEASGDLHGANLIKALQKESPDLEVRSWGGEKMQAAGATIAKHYRDLAFMGFLEVAMNIRTISKNFKFCKKDVLDFNPDLLILIDYPGFNLRMAKFFKEKGYQIHYYISPQVWAWKENRVEKIKTYVDHLYAILPFEEKYYRDRGLKIDYVGHPLLDAVEEWKKDIPSKAEFLKKYGLDERPFIALVPGSRKQEIEKILPEMSAVVNNFPDYQFVIAGSPTIDQIIYKKSIGNKPIHIVRDATHQIMSHACAALVTSGTATLETALFETPQVVCYKGGWLSYQIAKRLIKVKYISLVNLILDRMLVTELIQDDLNKKNLKTELQNILTNETQIKLLKAGYTELKTKLGGGNASQVTAQLMLKNLRKA